MKLRDIALATGPGARPSLSSVPDGACFLAVDAEIMKTGGSGVGENPPAIYDYYRVRIYRDGSLTAHCVRITRHERYGEHGSSTRCDQTLDCETLNELVAAIGHVRVPRTRNTCFEVSDPCLELCLGPAVEKLPEAPWPFPGCGYRICRPAPVLSIDDQQQS